MKDEADQLVSVFKTALEAGLEAFETSGVSSSLSDIYLQLDEDTVILSVYDDVEHLLQEINLEEVQDSDPERFETRFVQSLKQAVALLNEEHAFDKEFIYKPFAVSIVNEDFVITEELLFLDDETMKLDREMLMNMDKELDDFLTQLME